MLLGLCGKPTVGKSEVTNFLIANHGFRLLDTKAVLREMTSCLTRMPPELLKQASYKEVPYQGKTGREIMGQLGWCLEKMFGDDYLLRRALHRVDLSENIVVDSLRQDQALFFEGKVIEVVSDKVDEAVFSFDIYNKTKIDYQLDNSGDLSALSEKVSQMMLDLTSQDK